MALGNRPGVLAHYLRSNILLKKSIYNITNDLNVFCSYELDEIALLDSHGVGYVGQGVFRLRH